MDIVSVNNQYKANALKSLNLDYINPSTAHYTSQTSAFQDETLLCNAMCAFDLSNNSTIVDTSNKKLCNQGILASSTTVYPLGVIEATVKARTTLTPSAGVYLGIAQFYTDTQNLEFADTVIKANSPTRVSQSSISNKMTAKFSDYVLFYGKPSPYLTHMGISAYCRNGIKQKDKTIYFESCDGNFPSYNDYVQNERGKSHQRGAQFDKQFQAIRFMLKVVTLPSLVTNVSANITPNSITLSWQPPSDTGGGNINSYKIIVKDARGATLQTYRGIVQTSITIGSLFPQNKYNISIYAYNDFSINWSNIEPMPFTDSYITTGNYKIYRFTPTNERIKSIQRYSGLNRWTPISNAYRYDETTNTWVSLIDEVADIPN